MKLYVLFAQRHEAYDGEYAPEALACMDDVGNDINPGYLVEEMKKAKHFTDIVDAKIFEIELPKGTSDYIRNQLTSKTQPVKAVNIAIMEE